MSLGRYCQERATQILNDFAAAGTFLLNCEEAVSRWSGSCLVSFTNGSMYRRPLLPAQSSPAFSSRLNPAAARSSLCFSTGTNEKTYRCSQRTTPGDAPVIRRKCLAKWL